MTYRFQVEVSFSFNMLLARFFTGLFIIKTGGISPLDKYRLISIVNIWLVCFLLWYNPILLLVGNKRLKKKIEGLKKQINKHKDKIKRERLKILPDKGMIKHWEVEIFSFKKGIEKTMRRLKK